MLLDEVEDFHKVRFFLFTQSINLRKGERGHRDYVFSEENALGFTGKVLEFRFAPITIARAVAGDDE